jgi:hypothetical protein
VKGKGTQKTWIASFAITQTHSLIVLLKKNNDSVCLADEPA